MNAQYLLKEESRLKREKKAGERLRMRRVAVEMVADGHTYTDVAKRLDVSRSTVAHLVAEHARRTL